MHAEPARDRHRIDEPREHRPARVAEVVALGEHEPRHPLGRIAFGRARELLRAEAGAIDHRVDARADCGSAPPKCASQPPPDGHQPLDRRVERDDAAAILKVAAQRQHEAVAVDDAGLRRAHRATQASAGSSLLAAAPSMSSTPSTPLICACLRIASSRSISSSLVATTSLPHLRCGTPWEAQNS